MCTAANYYTDDHYFGRNFDLEFSYNETVVITPRDYTFNFRKTDDIEHHYAIIGMAIVVEDYPLYYDATNEKGLSIAGLNFPENADYKEYDESKINITPFELIPWILSKCSTVSDAEEILKEVNLVNINFNDKFPLSPLHWIISDKEKSITVECVKDGLKVYDNPLGVLTNNPPFDIQLFNINNYRNISIRTPENTFTDNVELDVYSRGMGGLGIPGDLSSQSRFVKVAFTKEHSISGSSESESISQFFHILESVEQQKGCVEVEPGKYEYTIYSSCVNTDKLIYYYKTYENSQITGVKLFNENLDSDKLIVYPLIKEQQINIQN